MLLLMPMFHCQMELQDIETMYLEARVMKSQVADTEHVLLAILKDKDNLAATVLEANHVNYQQVFEQLSLQPDISAGMGFTEDDDDEEEMNQSRSSHGSGERQQQAQTASRKPTNDTPVLDNFGTDMTKAAEEGRLDLWWDVSGKSSAWHRY